MRKNKARELPDIQTGSFHIHYCIFKRQVLTAHFCSARKERGFFFSFFPFGLFEISAWMFLFLFQQMDKQMEHYGYVECSGRKVETETGRPGYSWLSPSLCSCNCPDICLWTWRDGYPWESWWQVLTSIIRVGCNINRNHGYLKILFGVRSWCDWRATTMLRTGGRQSWNVGSSFQLSEARLAHQSARQHPSPPCGPSVPAHLVLNHEQKAKRENAQRKKCKDGEGQKFRED